MAGGGEGGVNTTEGSVEERSSGEIAPEGLGAHINNAGSDMLA